MTSAALTLNEYFALTGGGYTRHDAHVIGPVLAELQKVSREVTPNQVLDAGRSPTSPIHAYFEWDDTTAAERYRLTQAKGMLLSIRVRVADRKPEAPAQRRPTSLPVPAQSQAVRLNDGEDALAGAITQSAMQALKDWRAKYQPYCARWPRFQSIFGEVIADIEDCQVEFSGGAAPSVLTAKCVQCGAAFTPKHARHKLCEAC